MLFLYKNELNDRIVLEIIDILKTRPSWWIIYLLYIINDPKVTYQKDTTLIISIYGLKPHRIIILYSILKRFYQLGLIKKVIYKKEFVIVHMIDVEAFRVLSSKDYWKLLLIKYLIEEEHIVIDEKYSLQIINNQIHLKFLDSNISKIVAFSCFIPTLKKRIKQLFENYKS